MHSQERPPLPMPRTPPTRLIVRTGILRGLYALAGEEFHAERLRRSSQLSVALAPEPDSAVGRPSDVE